MKRFIEGVDRGQSTLFDRFLIPKRTFGEAAANDRFWSIPAIAAE
jgi:hypothetical protein